MGAITQERAHWVAKELLPHEAGLRSWLARRIKPPLEVDDIVQETYAVFGALEDIAHIRSPRNYMFQTAHSLVAASIRRANVVTFESLVELEGMEFASDRPSPEEDVMARLELQRVKALIEALPARQRQAFALFKVQGLTQRDIAHRMGVSQGTVEKHLAKALATLIVAIGRGGKASAEASAESGRPRGSKPSRAGDEFTD